MAPTQRPSSPAAKRTRIPTYTSTVSTMDGTSLTPANSATSCSTTPLIQGLTRKQHPRPTPVPLATYVLNPNAPGDAPESMGHLLPLTTIGRDRRGAEPKDRHQSPALPPRVPHTHTSLLHYLRGCLIHILRARPPNTACFSSMHPPSNSHRKAGPQTHAIL
jgi:hypothetical protein